jgi:hypothetical protein
VDALALALPFTLALAPSRFSLSLFCLLFDSSNYNASNVTAALAYNPDLIVLHLGFGGRPGEQTDLTNLSMYSNQSVMLETALAAGKPLIIVMFTNLPMDITKLVADPRVSAIVQAYYPQHWGNSHALEHILFLALLPCPSHSLTS